jgi:excisionase family DNA binding protein
MPAHLLTTGDVARRCSVKPDTVLKWIKKGRLPATLTIGGHYRVDENDLAPLMACAPAPDAHGASKPPLLSSPLRCWEFMSEGMRENCKTCVAYRVRANWCFRLAGVLKSAGHSKQFCTGSCPECPYYRRVHGLPTNVLVVTRDERLIQDLARRESSQVAFRFARSAYDASAVVSVFRPAYAVVDQNLLENGEPGLLDALRSDARSPGVRVLLAVRRGVVHGRPPKMAIAGTIEEPFTAEDIAALVARFPVESLPAEESEKAAGKET